MSEYLTETEFLKNYNPENYERLSMTVDVLIISISTESTTNYRKLGQKKCSILLTKKKNHPFKDKWCLPGGFIKMTENLDTAAMRILKEETNLDNIYIEQLYTFSDPKRDPRMRVITTPYMSLIDKNRLKSKLNKNVAWFDVNIIESNDSYHVSLDNDQDHLKFVVTKTLRELTTDRYEFKIKKNPDLAFDNPLVIVSGLERLKNKIEYTDIVFNMMPEYFTLGELQQVYEVILGKELLDPAFRRIIANKVVKTTRQKTGGGHRPSYYYTYKNKIKKTKK